MKAPGMEKRLKESGEKLGEVFRGVGDQLLVVEEVREREEEGSDSE